MRRIEIEVPGRVRRPMPDGTAKDRVRALIADAEAEIEDLSAAREDERRP